MAGPGEEGPTPRGPPIDRRRRFAQLRLFAGSFRGLSTAVAFATFGILIALAGELVAVSWGSVLHNGPGFLVGHVWDPVHNVYGAVPAVEGTLVTSGLALLLAVPVALGSALFLTEFAPPRFRGPIITLVDLSAAVPSVVWGFWAILVVAPWLQRSVEPTLARLTAGTGPFSGSPTGFDVLAASVVLAIMILPTISALSRSAIEAVPRGQREAALALGATRPETTRLAVLRPARSGIVAAILLGFGRAAGEAIIVVSLIGNIYTSPVSLFSQSQTIAGEVLNDLNSGSTAERGALVELALVLLVLTLLVQLGARFLTRAAGDQPARATSHRSSRARRLAGRIHPPERTADPVGPISAVLSTPRARDRRPRPGRARRRTVAAAVAGLAAAASVLTLIPLASVAWTAFSVGGGAAARPSFYVSELPVSCPALRASACPIGGIGPALEGTVLLLALASLVSVPLGLLAGIYLSEYAGGRRAGLVRVSADLLVGVPSVLIGLFVVLVLLDAAPDLENTALAGGAALGLLMVPIVTRATEEALRAVPASAREGALALGFPKHRTILRVVLPSARGGLVTGIFLAVARAGGETAALVLTAFGSPYWFSGWNHPIASLTLVIFQQGAESSYPNWQVDAWGAALVLLGLMLGVSLLARLAARGRAPSEKGE
ncbi:MAG TPA: phosphate ABC transporter permease subunit PstC [Thermoplasmata archaeon]|nr:phosphate ABC transporter permease subunit PstC [Thermoplasmata archaeon]